MRNLPNALPQGWTKIMREREGLSRPYPMWTNGVKTVKSREEVFRIELGESNDFSRRKEMRQEGIQNRKKEKAEKVEARRQEREEKQTLKQLEATRKRTEMETKRREREDAQRVIKAFQEASGRMQAAKSFDRTVKQEKGKLEQTLNSMKGDKAKKESGLNAQIKTALDFLNRKAPQLRRDLKLDEMQARIEAMETELRRVSMRAENAERELREAEKDFLRLKGEKEKLEQTTKNQYQKKKKKDDSNNQTTTMDREPISDMMSQEIEDLDD